MIQAERAEQTVGALASTYDARPKAKGISSASSSSAKQELRPPPPPPPPAGRPVKQEPRPPQQEPEYIVMEDDPMEPPFEETEDAAAAATSQQETMPIEELDTPMPSKEEPEPSQQEPMAINAKSEDAPDWGPDQQEEEDDQGVWSPITVESDSEDEREQCEAILRSMDSLVASEKLKEQRRAMANGETPSMSRFELLVKVQRLMQTTMSRDRKLTEDCEVENEANPAEADQTKDDDTATSLDEDKSQGQGSQKKESDAAAAGEEAEEVLPLPQAREFMASKGFKSLDEVVDGMTLVHYCCTESATRNMFGCWLR